MDPLALVLTAIGGQAVVVGLIAWLGRSVMSQVLARELEQFKSTLSREAAISIEQTRHQLSLRAHEHQITFSKLHEKRLQVVAELYEKLIASTNTALEFSGEDVEGGSREWKARYAAVMGAVSSLRDSAQAAKIYLPAALAEEVGKYANRLHAEVLGLAVYTKLPGSSLPPGGQNTRYEHWQHANRFFHDKLPLALQALEDEFHKLVGSESDA
jgi:hypothetical protein